jgi:hypothetical protein
MGGEYARGGRGGEMGDYESMSRQTAMAEMRVFFSSV